MMTDADEIAKTGLYIHIPFCVKKCNYCAFLSFEADSAAKWEYTQALINEINAAAKAYAPEDGS